ncbi:MAG: hypothetical protein AAF086_05395 [Planctomycetota bacterium]
MTVLPLCYGCAAHKNQAVLQTSQIQSNDSQNSFNLQPQTSSTFDLSLQFPPSSNSNFFDKLPRFVVLPITLPASAISDREPLVDFSNLNFELDFDHSHPGIIPRPPNSDSDIEIAKISANTAIKIAWISLLKESIISAVAILSILLCYFASQKLNETIEQYAKWLLIVITLALAVLLVTNLIRLVKPVSPTVISAVSQSLDFDIDALEQQIDKLAGSIGKLGTINDLVTPNAANSIQVNPSFEIVPHTQNEGPAAYLAVTLSAALFVSASYYFLINFKRIHKESDTNRPPIIVTGIHSQSESKKIAWIDWQLNALRIILLPLCLAGVCFMLAIFDPLFPGLSRGLWLGKGLLCLALLILILVYAFWMDNCMRRRQ